jgi:tRNA modification GTPase
VTADTIFALSSGSPPAAVAVLRISGPRAADALRTLAGRLPEPRVATLATLRWRGEELDRALVLRFPGPHTVTGEDVAELHLHGGRAVVTAVQEALKSLDGLRPAEPGEFTRRAFENGRVDLTEAEGLADLLLAETQSQRRAALTLAGGALSRQVEAWRQRLLELAAAIEAALDFSDEGEVAEGWPEGWEERRQALASEIAVLLSRPSVERLRDGIRVVIAGPTNAGKSSLLNALVQREAAITSPVPGTTRDVIEVPVALGGMPFLLIDTAGLRETADEVERLGLERARASVGAADLILWLGRGEDAPGVGNVIRIRSKSDLPGEGDGGELRVSALTGEGLDRLEKEISDRARGLVPGEGDVAVNARQREALTETLSHLRRAEHIDMLIAAEALRQARNCLDQITGHAGVEDLLDKLFGRFCIGK